MPRCECPRWRRVPGYDSEGDNSDDEQDDKFRVRTQQRLADIVDVLSLRRWRELPVIPFSPAPAQRTNRLLAAEKAAKIRSLNTVSPGPTPAFRVERACSPVVHETLACNGLTPAGSTDHWCVKWCGMGMKDVEYANLLDFQRVNHFPHSTELTRKDTMFRHLHAMAHVFGKEDFDFLPETYVLPDQIEAFRAEYARRQGIWIVKPTNASCGRGIFLLKDIADLPATHKNAVVSRYVDNPLLIQGLKFDLRVYVLVTQYEPLRCYIYREGLARFASQPYSTEKEHLQDVYRHLTNYSINKFSPTFKENQQVQADNYGHKWSLSALNRHLRHTGVDVDLMWSRINDLIVKTLLAVEPSIGGHLRRLDVPQGACFELYGFDILVDDTLKPWIIEVNMSPSMATESPLDWQVKSSLLSDTLNLVGVHNPDYKAISLSRLELQMRERYRLARRPTTQRDRGVIFPGLRRKNTLRGHANTTSGLLGSRSTPSPIADEPVQLNRLGDGELRFLVRSLEELSRSPNFILLHPTKSSVECYAAITEARSLRGNRRNKMLPAQLLASVLFGPAPVHGTPKLPTAISNAITEAVTAGSSPVARTQMALAGKLRAVAAARAQNAGRSTDSRAQVNSEQTTGAPVSEDVSEVDEESEEDEDEEDEEEEEELLALDDEEDDRADLLMEEDSRAPEEDSRAPGEDSTGPEEVEIRNTVQESANIIPSVENKAFKEERHSLQSPSSTRSSPSAREAHVAIGKNHSQLPMMEYLARICDYCEALGTQDRARLAHSSAFSRLSSFCGWLRKAAAESAPDAADTDGDLIEEILATCRSCLATMAGEQRTTLDEMSEESGRSPKASVSLSHVRRELVRHLPPEMAQDPTTSRYLSKLSLLPDAELEHSIRARPTHADKRARSFSYAEDASTAASRSYSPLAELLRARQRMDQSSVSGGPPATPGLKTLRSPVNGRSSANGPLAPAFSRKPKSQEGVWPADASRAPPRALLLRERDQPRSRSAAALDFASPLRSSSTGLVQKRSSTRFPSAPSLPELRPDTLEQSLSFEGYRKVKTASRGIPGKDSPQPIARLPTYLHDHNTTVEL